MIQVDSVVRIKETAFDGSDEELDVLARGQTAVIITSLGDELGAEWADCWEARLDNGDVVQVVTEELEEVSPLPNTPGK